MFCIDTFIMRQTSALPGCWRGSFHIRHSTLSLHHRRVQPTHFLENDTNITCWFHSIICFYNHAFCSPVFSQENMWMRAQQSIFGLRFVSLPTSTRLMSSSRKLSSFCSCSSCCQQNQKHLNALAFVNTYKHLTSSGGLTQSWVSAITNTALFSAPCQLCVGNLCSVPLSCFSWLL